MAELVTEQVLHFVKVFRGNLNVKSELINITVHFLYQFVPQHGKIGIHT